MQVARLLPCSLAETLSFLASVAAAADDDNLFSYRANEAGERGGIRARSFPEERSEIGFYMTWPAERRGKSPEDVGRRAQVTDPGLELKLNLNDDIIGATNLGNMSWDDQLAPPLQCQKGRALMHPTTMPQG